MSALARYCLVMAKVPLELGFGEPPSNVQVTVLRVADDRNRRGRATVGARLRVPPVAVAFLVVATIGAALALGGGGDPSRGVGVLDAGPAGVVAAYGYPASCVDVRISAVDPTFARGDVTRATSCSLYRSLPSAVFHRFGGEWHPVLYTVTYPCPMPSIPRAVQRQLALCPG